ncbi:hypothetical protein KEJ27_01535 [Candidatus Bathyarchaeota archaeon]|nr:hypothetical protein [Candidatus Bathyarchaeota archaeon]MBS7613016.1 hypothetical protein [Candidatus Bathyarchaeota archaeon]MBS7617641.1 hypothetical protein [Candidatus Bathyarchaeota archaeon]
MKLEIPRIILGAQPFLGESYQGEEKNSVYRIRFSNVYYTVELLRKAYESGLNTVSVMSMPGNELFKKLLEALRLLKKEDTVFQVAPCISIPLKLEDYPVDDYRRWLTYFDYECRYFDPKELEKKYLKDPILLTRPNWRRLFLQMMEGGKPYNQEDFEKIQVDFKLLENRVSAFEEFEKPFINLGSECDFLAMTGRLDILNRLIEWLKSKGFSRVLISSHHAGSTIPIIENSGLKIDGYVTPVNPIGALMLPTAEEALKAIRLVADRVVAIKPLAGGRVNPYEAFNFLTNNNIKHFMLGVASLEELKADLEAVGQVFQTFK